MPPRTLPGLGLQGYWTLGEDNWKDAMDANLLKLSVFGNLEIKGTVTDGNGAFPLPTTGLQNGDIYVSEDGEPYLKVRENGAWVTVQPLPGQIATIGQAAFQFYVYPGDGPENGAWHYIRGARVLNVFVPGSGLSPGEVLFRDYVSSGISFQNPGSAQRLGFNSIPANRFEAKTPGSTASTFYYMRNGVVAATVSFAAGSTLGVFSKAVNASPGIYGGTWELVAGNEVAPDIGDIIFKLTGWHDW